MSSISFAMFFSSNFAALSRCLSLARLALRFCFISFDPGFIGVEICEAEAINFNSTSDLFISGVGISFEHAYSKPMLGTSIGPAGDGSTSGSLGFYLKIEHQGKTEVLAVTCCQFVAPGMYILLVFSIPYSFTNQPGI